MKGLLLCAALALPTGAPAQSLLSESFARSGVIAAPGKPSAQWATEAGRLLSKRGTGYSDSKVLRLFTRRDDLGGVSVTFNLLLAAFAEGSPDEQQPWDGVHLWLRYQSEERHYDIGLNRRDNTVVVKKKAPGPDGAATFFTIGAPAGYAIPFNSWQSARVTIVDQPNGSVAVAVYLDGALLLSVVDDGSQGGAPITGAGRVGVRADNAELHLADFQIETLRAADTDAAVGFVAARAAVKGSQAAITWRTPQEADSQVQYGPTAEYGSSALGGFGKDHAVTLNLAAPGTYHYRVLSRGSKGALQSADAVFTIAAPEAGGFTAVLTAPAQGQQVSGLGAVSAAAGDGAGPVSVRFLLDGAPLGAPLQAAPYSLSFNSVLYANGAHTLTMVATSALGKQVVATSSFTISNGVTTNAAATAAMGVASAVPNAFPTPASAASPSAVAPAGGDGPAAVVGAPAAPGAAVAAAPAAPAPAAGQTAQAVLSAAAAAADPARAAERFLTPAVADGINDLAHFGAQASEVTIFDIRGRRVYHGSRQGGTLTWNGRDLTGRVVESGVYIAKVIRDDGKAVYQSFAVAK